MLRSKELEAKHEAELKIQLKQKEQDVIAQKDQESATMVEKAVTINTQKLEAQHSERIDSALRQAASDAAADKEVALSKQRAQLKEEADAKMFKQVGSRASRATDWSAAFTVARVGRRK